jgi:copper transport protein
LLRRLLACTVVLLALDTAPAAAHAGLRRADPAMDATLPVAPTAVRLSFSEEPEASLATVRVVDAGGASYELGPPQPVAGDPLTLVAQVRSLDQKVYTVSWRVVSKVDGHATAGAYVFGVGVSPTAQATAAAAGTEGPAPSRLELVARWVLVVGLVLLLGAACAGAARFGGPQDGIRLAAIGWAAAAIGLALLTVVQRRSAATTLGDFLDTSVGRAVQWRAAAIAVAGVALALARVRRAALWGTALAAAAAMAVHAAAGHAAGGASQRWLDIAAQWVHFAALGVWVGGLSALLLGLRGAPSPDKAAAVRRFSAVAGPALALVVVTGVLRAVDELEGWGDLMSTGYGRAVLLKSALLVGMAGLGARNRWRSVPRAAADLVGLRRLSSVEIGLAAVAFAAAAVLTTISPPAGQAVEATGLSVTGVDFATTSRVYLSTQSSSPGPNRFVVQAVDYDSGAPIRAGRASLRFRPLDDPDVATTSLALEPGPDGTYAGTGANLSLDGRWRVTVLLELGAQTVTVPLEVTVPGPPQFLSVERVPGRPIRYTVQVAEGTYMRVHADPGREGPSRVHAAFFDDFGDEWAIDALVLTTARESDRARQHAVQRLGRGRFVADVTLTAPVTRVSAVARARDGTRFRAVVEVEVAD